MSFKAKKNQKMGLEDSVKLAKRELEKMVQPKVTMHAHGQLYKSFFLFIVIVTKQYMELVI